MANVQSVHLFFFEATSRDDHPKFHMTTDQPEIVTMEQDEGWQYASQTDVYAFNQQVVGTVPLYRYRNSLSEDHFFTTSKEEGDRAIVKYNAIPEGLCCYLSPVQSAGTIPLYRLLTDYGYHWYSTDVYARARHMAENWEDEGITGFVWLNQISLALQ